MPALLLDKQKSSCYRHAPRKSALHGRSGAQSNSVASTVQPSSTERIHMYQKYLARFHCLVIFSLLVVPANSVLAFTYADFSSVAGLNLVGSTAQNGSALRLTPPAEIRWAPP